MESLEESFAITSDHSNAFRCSIFAIIVSKGFFSNLLGNGGASYSVGHSLGERVTNVLIEY